MSILVKVIDVADPETGEIGMAAIIKHCNFEKSTRYKKGGTAVKDVVKLYEIYDGGYVALPFSKAIELVKKLVLPVKIPIIPDGIVRHPKPSQMWILNAAFEHLSLHRSIMLINDPGMGKTFMSLYMAIAYGYPTIAICLRVENCKQWANDACEIIPSLASKICLRGSVSDASTLFTATPENAQFLMIRAGLLAGMDMKILARYRFVILDETHLLATEGQLSGILRCCRTLYVVGCSGTPEKPDGRHRLIELILGTRAIVARTDRIIDFMLFDVNVFTSEDEYRKVSFGKNQANDILVEYGAMERSIAYNPLTNNRIAVLIACLVRIHKHKVLVMSKYTLQCNAIMACLLAWGISATVYTGKNKNYDGFADVIIGTTQLTMTAFDQATCGIAFDRRFNAAVMCQSLAQDGNLWQAIGRIMRAPDTDSPVFVWLQYNMKAYAEHTSEMLKAVNERKLRVRDKDFKVPKDVYERCFGKSVEIDIIRTEPFEEGVIQHRVFKFPPMDSINLSSDKPVEERRSEERSRSPSPVGRGRSPCRRPSPRMVFEEIRF
jgi:superfamily II DNA or RNA helicase